MSQKSKRRSVIEQLTRQRFNNKEGGTMKLQQYAVNKQCPTKDGNPNMVWHIRAEFTSFKVLGQNDTYIYLKVEDGITTKINLKGKPLTTSQKKRFGVHDSGMSGPS